MLRKWTIRISDFRSRESGEVSGDEDKVQGVTGGNRWSGSISVVGGHWRLDKTFSEVIWDEGRTCGTREDRKPRFRVLYEL